MPDTPRGETGDRPVRPERRDFLTRIGVGACAVAAVGSGVVTLDFMKPKVLFEPPTTFKAGDPGDYSEGTIRFNKEKKAYVCGGPGGVYALSAVCTHLGCITRFLSDQNVIACRNRIVSDIYHNIVHCNRADDRISPAPDQNISVVC